MKLRICIGATVFFVLFFPALVMAGVPASGSYTMNYKVPGNETVYAVTLNYVVSAGGTVTGTTAEGTLLSGRASGDSIWMYDFASGQLLFTYFLIFDGAGNVVQSALSYAILKDNQTIGQGQLLTLWPDGAYHRSSRDGIDTGE
jgi:outer membrane protein assembly factor BamB